MSNENGVTFIQGIESSEALGEHLDNLYGRKIALKSDGETEQKWEVIAHQITNYVVFNHLRQAIAQTDDEMAMHAYNELLAFEDNRRYYRQDLNRPFPIEDKSPIQNDADFRHAIGIAKMYHEAEELATFDENSATEFQKQIFTQILEIYPTKNSEAHDRLFEISAFSLKHHGYDILAYCLFCRCNDQAVDGNLNVEATKLSLRETGIAHLNHDWYQVGVHAAIAHSQLETYFDDASTEEIVAHLALTQLGNFNESSERFDQLVSERLKERLQTSADPSQEVLSTIDQYPSARGLPYKIRGFVANNLDLFDTPEAAEAFLSHTGWKNKRPLYKDTNASSDLAYAAAIILENDPGLELSDKIDLEALANELFHTYMQWRLRGYGEPFEPYGWLKLIDYLVQHKGVSINDPYFDHDEIHAQVEWVESF